MGCGRALRRRSRRVRRRSSPRSRPVERRRIPRLAFKAGMAMDWTFHEGELDATTFAPARAACRRDECRVAAVGVPRPRRRCACHPAIRFFTLRDATARCSAAARSSGSPTTWRDQVDAHRARRARPRRRQRDARASRRDGARAGHDARSASKPATARCSPPPTASTSARGSTAAARSAAIARAISRLSTRAKSDRRGHCRLASPRRSC